MYAGEIVEYGSLKDIFKDPRHPYTIGLLGSIPSLAKNVKRLNPIKGLMPDPTSLPGGCKFHTRCDYAAETCKAAIPPLRAAGEAATTGGSEHLVRCVYADSVLPGRGME
jgi:peptide/nickel transport system ATP-binding protein